MSNNNLEKRNNRKMSLLELCEQEGIAIEDKETELMLKIATVYETNYDPVYHKGIVPKIGVRLSPGPEFIIENDEWDLVHLLEEKLKTPQLQNVLKNKLGCDLSGGIEMDTWFLEPELNGNVIGYTDLEEARELALNDSAFNLDNLGADQSPVDIMYGQLLEKVAWNDMQQDGKFISYFRNVDEFKEGLGLEVGNLVHEKAFKEMLKEEYGFNLKDMQEDFIVIESQDKFGGTLWNKDNTVDEIMDFFKRDPSYKKYVHETGSRIGQLKHVNCMER